MARFQLVWVKVSWTVLLTLAHFTYLLFGATIFQMLEREAESNNRNHFQLEKLNFLANYTCLDRQALEKFVQVFLHFLLEFMFQKGRSESSRSVTVENVLSCKTYLDSVMSDQICQLLFIFNLVTC